MQEWGGLENRDIERHGLENRDMAELRGHTMMVTVLGVENKTGFGMEDRGQRADFKDIP